MALGQNRTDALIEQARAFDNTQRQELLNLLEPALANGVFDNFPEDKLEAIRLITNAHLNLGEFTKTLSYIEQLRSYAETHSNIFYQAQSYFYEGKVYSTQGQFQEALAAAEKSLTLFEQTGDQERIANLHVDISSAHRNLGRYMDALSSANMARRISESSEDVYGVASAFNAMAMVHSLMGNYQQALEAMLQTIALDRQAGRSGELATSYFNVADVYERMGDIEMAKQYYLDALDLDLAEGNPDHIGHDYVKLGDIARIQGDLPTARDYLIKAIDNFKSIDAKNNIAWAQNNIAQVELEDKNYDVSEQYLTEAAAFIGQADDDDKLIQNHILFADLFLHQNKLPQAHERLDAIEQMTVEMQATSHILRIFTLRSEIYQKQDDYKSALDAYQQYHELTSRLQQENRSVTIANLQNSVDFLNKEHQIDMLENEKRLRESQLQSTKFQRNAWIATFTAVVVFLAAMGYRQYSRRKIVAFHKQMSDELITQKDKMLAEVAHELKSPVTTLKLQIEALEYNLESDNQAAYRALNKRVTELNQTIEDLYQLAQADNGLLKLSFKPVVIKDAIQETLNSYDDVLEHHGLNLESDSYLTEDDVVKLDTRRFQQVLVNLLHNSMRYTQAPGQVQCISNREKNEVIFSIEDSPPAVNDDELDRLFERLYRSKDAKENDDNGSGLGLAICRTLIEAHGGTINAQKSSLGGLKIEVRLPIDSDSLLQLEPSE